MEKALKCLTTKQLQEELTRRDLDTGGLKTDLMKRLFLSISDQGDTVGSFLQQYFEQDDNDDEIMPDKEIFTTEKTSTGVETIPLKEIVNTERISTEVINSTLSNLSNFQTFLSLPPLNITRFNGNPADYPRFLTQINELILSSNISDTQKLSRIIQLLDGPPKNAIKCLEGLNGALSEALRILKTRFGEPYMIVFSTIENIINIKQLTETDKLGLQQYSDKIRCAYYTLKSMKQLGEVTTSHMIQILSKLPVSDQTRWRDHVASIRPSCPSFESLVNFIERRASSVNEPIFGNIVSSNKIEKSHKVSNSFATNTYLCFLCKENHKITQCSQFLKFSIDERKDFVYKNKLCINCLGRNHKISDCKSKVVCFKNNCGKRHNTLLHFETKASENFSAKTETSEIVNCSTYLQIVPIKILGPLNQSQDSFALLDTGSENTFISSSLATKLKLKLDAEPTDLTLKTLSGAQVIKCNYTNFTVCNPSNHDKKITAKNAIVMPNINVKMKNLPKPEEFKSYAHLQNIKLMPTEATKVEVIIGCDNPFAFIAEEYVKGKINEPIAIKTLLGWSIFGSSKRKRLVTLSETYSTSVEELEVIRLKQLISLDDDFQKSNSNDKFSRHDVSLIKNLEQSVTIDDNGRFVIPMLFNDNKTRIVNNKPIALRRVEFLRRKFEQSKPFYIRYKEVMDSYFDKNFASVVEPNYLTEGKLYLPHHAVINAKKPEKLRVVFDAASKHHDLSLNQALYQGPNLTNSLIGVLCRFREGKYAISADIETMFHRIRLPDNDKKYVRFLWWTEGIEKPLKECQMLVHVFGAACSPCIANFALKRTVKDYPYSIESDVAESILKNFYVDDFLKASCDPKHLYKIFQDVQSVLKYRDFNLTKLKTNIPFLINSQEENSVNLTRTLGIIWDIDNDVFQFPKMEFPTNATKRSILSTTSMLFDPIGFLAPLTLVPKVILQELWKKNIDWDSEIPNELLNKWNKWLSSLENLSSICIPRCIRPRSNHSTAELHSFSDASQTAFGAAIYLRLVFEENDIVVSFVLGKTKVAPIKFVSIPRLELQAAVLSVNLVSQLLLELEVKIDKKYFWTDSMTTLKYITNEHLKLSIYEANRVRKILDSSESSEWSYVPTKLNSADDASRGLNCDEFTKSCRWWTGPNFLYQEADCWPKQPSIEVQNMSTLVKNNFDESFDYLISYFSDLSKLRNSIAWFKRFLLFLSKKDMCKSGPLTIEEIESSDIVVAKFVQEKHFHLEIDSLKKTNRVSKTSSLLKLRPFIDNLGILRVGGRIDNSSRIPYTQKHPIILPKNSFFSLIVCRYYHTKNLHSSKETTIAATRNKFWIICVRQIIKHLIKKCFTCRKLDARRSEQLMGNLPSSRLETYSPPFSICGVDFFGPFESCLFRRKVKRYGVVFICFLTKAVHIEMCPSLDCDDFMNTFIQFTSRRGQVKELWSDNATNFTASNKLLKNIVQEWTKDGLEQKLKQKCVQWKFNPPTASHMGGLWERAIRSIRRCLMVCTNGQSFDDHRLRTLLTITECMLNNRPLRAVSDDPNDDQCLTPNHFLLLREAPCYTYECTKMISSRTRWVHVQKLADSLWKHWLSHYLPLLQHRQKWNKTLVNLKLNDIVLVSNENTKRGEWPLGRIINVFADSEGVVRKVEIRTQSGVFVRPIHKLCLLEESC